MISVSSRTNWNYHKKLVKLSKLAKESEKVKNQIVNSLWYSQGWTKKKNSLNKKKNRVKSIASQYDTCELTKVAEAIDKIETAIDALIFKYINHYPV